MMLRECDTGEEVTDFMKEEKKRKQREAVAEDLFHNEKVSIKTSSLRCIKNNLEINQQFYLHFYI